MRGILLRQDLEHTNSAVRPVMFDDSETIRELFNLSRPLTYDSHRADYTDRMEASGVNKSLYQTLGAYSVDFA